MFEGLPHPVELVLIAVEDSCYYADVVVRSKKSHPTSSSLLTMPIIICREPDRIIASLCQFPSIALSLPCTTIPTWLKASYCSNDGPCVAIYNHFPFARCWCHLNSQETQPCIDWALTFSSQWQNRQQKIQELSTGHQVHH